MDESTKQKFLLWLAVIFIVVFGGYLLWHGFPPKTIAPQGINVTGSTGLVPVVSRVPDSVTPTAIPTDLPMEAGAKIIQNSDIKNGSSSQKQSVREYVLSGSLEDAYKAYQAYFIKNKWSITSQYDGTSTKYLAAKQNLLNMSVVFGTNSITHENTANVTVLYYQQTFAPGTTITVDPTTQKLLQSK